MSIAGLTPTPAPVSSLITPSDTTPAPQLLTAAPTPAETLRGLLSNVAIFLQNVISSNTAAPNLTYTSPDLSGVVRPSFLTPVTVTSVLSGIVSFLQFFTKPFGANF
jgi:hypothetical protein